MKYEKSLLCKEICNAINSDCSKHCNLKGACEQCENIADALLGAGARFPICKTGDIVYEIYPESVQNEDVLFGWEIKINFRPVMIAEIRIVGDTIRYYTERYKGKIEEVRVFTLTPEEADDACSKCNCVKGEELICQ